MADAHVNKIRAAQMFGATRWQIFRHVIIPSTVSPILTGMRVSMGISFMTVIAAEMLAAESGIGYLILNSRLWMATDKIFVGIFVLGCPGIRGRSDIRPNHWSLGAQIPSQSFTLSTS